MEALICSSQPPALHLSRPSSTWKPKSLFLNPKTLKSLNQRSITQKPQANAKGFGNVPESVREKPKGKNSNKNDNNGDNEDISQVVFERMLLRIAMSVGGPIATGLALLHIFGLVKEQHLWDIPIWIPILTTALTFGASTLGIAYGALSTSWDPEKSGSVLGFEQVQSNWIEMWQEEDEDNR